MAALSKRYWFHVNIKNVSNISATLSFFIQLFLGLCGAKKLHSILLLLIYQLKSIFSDQLSFAFWSSLKETSHFNSAECCLYTEASIYKVENLLTKLKPCSIFFLFLMSVIYGESFYVSLDCLLHNNQLLSSPGGCLKPGLILNICWKTNPIAVLT